MLSWPLLDCRQRKTLLTRKNKITATTTKWFPPTQHFVSRHSSRCWSRRGLVDRAALDVLVDAFEQKVGPRNGARVVARAWIDPAYKKRLLADGGPAIAELGYKGETGEHLIVVENTPKIHNLVVYVRSTPAIRGPCSVYRPYGTNPHPIAREP